MNGDEEQIQPKIFGNATVVQSASNIQPHTLQSIDSIDMVENENDSTDADDSEFDSIQ